MGENLPIDVRNASPSKPYLITDLFPRDLIARWTERVAVPFVHGEQGPQDDDFLWRALPKTEGENSLEPLRTYASKEFPRAKFSEHVLFGGANGSHFPAHNHAMALLLLTE